MELYPKQNYLRFETLSLSGIYEKFMPVKYIVPLTPHDYWANQKWVHFHQAPHLDLEMIYGHVATKETFVFGKQGEWFKEGVDHPNLSLENTYKETNWFDEFNPHNS